MTRFRNRKAVALASVALLAALASAVVITAQRFHGDMALAQANAARGSVLVQTACGLVEYQEAGAGAPLLAVHGSGGGHDQGMAFAGTLAQQGIRVIAMSRFGYLRTPMPADSAPPMPAWVERSMMQMIGSDFLFWAALHVARDSLIELVLATPPALLNNASPQERARVDRMLDHILPVSRTR